VSVFQRALEVDHGQHEEHESLDAVGQREQEVHGKGADHRSQGEQQDQDDFLTADVAEKTEGEGKRPGQVRNDFNGQHERHQPPERSHEVLDVLGPPHADAPEVVVEEHRDGHGGVGVHVVGGGIEAGNQPDDVAGNDEQEQAGQEGENLTAFFADVFHHEGLQAADDDLEEILETAGDQLQLAGGEHAQNDEQQHDEPRVDDVGVDDRCVKDVVELVQPDSLGHLFDQ